MLWLAPASLIVGIISVAPVLTLYFSLSPRDSEPSSL